MDDRAESGTCPAWVEVDIDVLDAPYCPHTACPVPGGMSYTALVNSIHAVAHTHHIVGMSLVEVGDHPYDLQVAAHLLYKMVGAALYSRRPLPEKNLP